ncbi:Alpha/Beta hydrolase protein, partial [Boeremia exigua]|uniref:Alpha/Beta hydrolase protein n=1 Tax=Boeremia exigua TaxID=749465 RepID=UPI001E8E3F81
MAATNNPLEGPPTLPPVSAQTLTIAGILVTVHGLAELPPNCTSVTCLWLLNPRLQTKETMAPIATALITRWNTHSQSQSPTLSAPRTGLIAAAFDARNHGTRLATPLHNEAWRQGNPTHAQDMFGVYAGTAADCAGLIDHLPSYLPGLPALAHAVLGVSLGGHAAWHVLLSDPRVRAGVVGIGCPDYARLMADRARLSRRETYLSTTPPGAGFFGSPDFPPALVDAVARFDPAGLLLPAGADAPVSDPARARFRALVRQRLQGKRILNLSGAEDKLVPYAAGAPFLKVFKEVVADKALDVGFEDVLFEGTGHVFSAAMVERAGEWVCEVLGGRGGG